LYPRVLLWFSTSDYPFVSSCSSLVFNFRLPLCILLVFFGFRPQITPLHPPVLLWFSTSDYPFVSSCSSLVFDFRIPLCIILFFFGFDLRLPLCILPFFFVFDFRLPLCILKRFLSVHDFRLLFPLTLLVRIPLSARCTTLSYKVCQ
jgi:hypothetical protein